MPAPTCPRCGYDQSGVVPTWAAAGACPLRGTCSECGAGFEWADVFSPNRLILRGFFEHARGPARALAWALVTLQWTLWPRIFWSRVAIDRYPVRWRATLWPLLAALPFYVLGSLAHNAEQLIIWMLYFRRGRYPDWTWWSDAWLRPVARTFPARPRAWGLRFDPGLWLLLAGPMLAFCIVFSAILFTIGLLPRTPRLPRALLVRGALYSLAWVPVAAALRLLYALWGLAQALDQYLTGGALRGWMGIPPFRVIAIGACVAVAAWLGLWWWHALAAALGRRRAISVWLAAAIPGAVVAALLLAEVQIALWHR